MLSDVGIFLKNLLDGRVILIASQQLGENLSEWWENYLDPKVIVAFRFLLLLPCMMLQEIRGWYARKTC